MDKHKVFIGCYNRSVILTYIGVSIAVYGIIVQLHSFSKNTIIIGSISLVLSGICDLFDGPIARMVERNNLEKAFGIQIDSLADIIISLILPIVIYNNLSSNQIDNRIITFISVTYTLCGIIRLAYFNITTDGNTKYYRGMPVTYAALIIPILICIMLKYNIQSSISSIILFSITMLTISILFILNIKVPKPKGIFYVIFPALAIIVILVLITEIMM